MAGSKKRGPRLVRDDDGMQASSGVAERTSRGTSSPGEKARRIQRDTDEREERSASSSKSSEQSSPQTGTTKAPEPPLPKQHLEKPGMESEMQLRPRYHAPGYKGSEKLQDMVAVVTGGDSGIGRAVSVLFAREGADVAIIYLEEHEDAEETKRAVEDEGRRALLIPGDVTEAAFCNEAVAQALDAFGRLDILVNNAAFQEHAASIEDITEEQFDLTMRTNLYGYFHMAKAVLPHLRAGGSIINTGSVTGIQGSSQLLDYSTTKGGIHAFTKSLAQNVLNRGIRVNCVAPGPVWTPLNPADSSAEKVAEFGSDVPMKRPAQPDEISPAFVFLAAPSCASYITGEVLPVLGGEIV